MMCHICKVEYIFNPIEAAKTNCKKILEIKPDVIINTAAITKRIVLKTLFNERGH